MRALLAVWAFTIVVGVGAVLVMGNGMVPLVWLVFFVSFARFVMGVRHLREQSAANMAKEG